MLQSGLAGLRLLRWCCAGFHLDLWGRGVGFRLLIVLVCSGICGTEFIPAAGFGRVSRVKMVLDQLVLGDFVEGERSGDSPVKIVLGSSRVCGRCVWCGVGCGCVGLRCLRLLGSRGVRARTALTAQIITS